MVGLRDRIGCCISDLIYALLTGLGMSIVIDFIEANQNILQILGSLVLVGFGLYLYRQNPAKNIRKANSSINTFTQDFITAFLLTFSNPLILFLYIGLFARFNFFLPESKPLPPGMYAKDAQFYPYPPSRSVILLYNFLPALGSFCFWSRK